MPPEEDDKKPAYAPRKCKAKAPLVVSVSVGGVKTIINFLDEANLGSNNKKQVMAKTKSPNKSCEKKKPAYAFRPRKRNKPSSSAVATAAAAASDEPPSQKQKSAAADTKPAAYASHPRKCKPKSFSSSAAAAASVMPLAALGVAKLPTTVTSVPSNTNKPTPPSMLLANKLAETEIKIQQLKAEMATKASPASSLDAVMLLQINNVLQESDQQLKQLKSDLKSVQKEENRVLQLKKKLATYQKKAASVMGLSHLAVSNPCPSFLTAKNKGKETAPKMPVMLPSYIPPPPYNYHSQSQAEAQEKLLAGRKRALEKQHQQDEETVAYLNEMNTMLQEKGELTETVASTKLVKTIVELFRHQVPTEWSERSQVYHAALHACRTLASKPELHVLLGTSSVLVQQEHSQTILASLAEFALHAEMIANRSSSFEKDNDNNEDLLLATHVLQVKELVQEACGEKNETKRKATKSLHDHYKAELGPLRFDIVDTLHKHYFMENSQSAPVSLDTRRVFKELTAYRTSLPVEYGSSVFVRAVDNRLDMLRALVIGPDNTPYANGCFIFDIFLTDKYPSGPPKVQFMTTAGGQVRFNPNLYKDGKVCLSLLGTWSGPGWVSGTSTLLQVLVSIQSLIFVPDPYFNEPGYETTRGTLCGDVRSESYNRHIRHETASHCIEAFLTQLVENDRDKCEYPEFSQVILNHFMAKKRDVEQQVQEWAKRDPTNLSDTSTKICSMLNSLARAHRVTMRNKARASQLAAKSCCASDAKPIAKPSSESGSTSTRDCSKSLESSMDGNMSDDDRKLPAKRIKTAPTEAQAAK